MLVVLALGGNALLRRGQQLDAEVQRRNLLEARPTGTHSTHRSAA
jgi:carbamate kinase